MRKRTYANLILPWVVFYIYLVWAWRVQDMFRQLPAYGDALEVVWGIEWYGRSLFVDRVSPLFTNRVFYPNGWHTATLATSPPLFLLAQPFRAIGGAAFAYNALSLLAQMIAFAGAYRFLRLYTTRPGAWIAAAMLSFWPFRWFRIGGHLNVLWASALLPWLAWVLERWGKEPVKGPFGRAALLAGLIWGWMINFSLYSLFLGALLILAWGGVRVLWKAAVFALLLSGPVLISYYIGIRADHVSYFDVYHLVWWGASLNSLAVPSVSHPIPAIQDVARGLYKGPGNESGVANLGLLTFLLVLIGTVAVLREGKGKRYARLFYAGALGVCFSLGLFLRWDGQIVSACVWKPVTMALWRIGHALKPKLFAEPLPGDPVSCGIPLPGLLFSAAVPFYEGARVASRYAFVAALGIVPLAAKGLEALRPTMRWALAALWVLEFLPRPFVGQPLPSQAHPAYIWVASHLPPGEGVVEVQYPTLRIGGDVLYASWLSGIPTASGVGSFYPQHTLALWRYFLDAPHAWENPETAIRLRIFGIRYILIYRQGEKEDTMIGDMRRNPLLRFVGCWDPLPGASPWPYPICVVEGLGEEEKAAWFRTSGWSGEEPWGVWAEGQQSEAVLWVAHPVNVRLSMEAFPHCVPGRNQALRVSVNGVEIAEHQWSDCIPWSGEWMIPSALLQPGVNLLKFQYAYAARPVDVTGGQNGDARWLSVGFSRLGIQEAH